MADILQEIDEELRRDKAEALWKKHGKKVIAVCIILIIAAGGYTWYQKYRVAQLQNLADEYSAAEALLATDDAAASKAFMALADSASDKGVALVARFQAASALAAGDDNAAAAKAFDTIAADTTVDPLYRDLAKLKYILHAALAGEDRQGLLAAIQPLTTDTNPWRYSARMVAASLAIGQGDVDQAKDYLKKIADDPDAPNSGRGQAAQILQALGN